MTADSNVCVGIDSGSSCSKLAYSDSLGTRVITQCEGFDFLELREEAEIFFDDLVFSCVLSVPENLTSRQKSAIKSKAELSGFRNVNLISEIEALKLAVNDNEENEKVLIYDFGASRSHILFFENGSVADSVIIDDVCGNSFDMSFAEYLRERKLLKKINDDVLREAKRLKHVLSVNNSRIWHNAVILRGDFERLIYFPVKRASHVLKRFMRVFRPDRVILTGGCSKIPLVREILDIKEVIDDLISKGCALKARSITKSDTAKNISTKSQGQSRLREIRAEMLRIEDKLTRNQKDRLYVLFRQAENINDNGITVLIETLLNEIENL